MPLSYQCFAGCGGCSKLSAPSENKFPSTFNDCYAVLNWISSHEESLNANGKLILLGDSAGGQPVGSLCVANVAEEKPILILEEVLINPALNLSKGSVSYKAYSLFIDWYVNDLIKPHDILVSPLPAKDFSKMPLAIIVLGEKDNIRDDGESYNKKLTEAGVKSSLFVQTKRGILLCIGVQEMTSLNLQ